MKNINKVFNTVTISLIILIGIGLMGTFLSDYLVSIDWFGDTSRTGKFWGSKEAYTIHEWGARHYWYNWGVFFLFITALLRAVFKVASIN
tara:strand:+ start:356 stop:625 length:270 start_codon:yes stop_codon:yes gene_type:complete